MTAFVFWDSLTEEARAVLTRTGVRKVFLDGHSLMLQGDVSDRVFIVRDGWIKVSINSATGVESVIDLVGPGDIVGDMEVIDGEPRQVTAMAKRRTETLAITGERFRRALADQPGIERLLLRQAIVRLRNVYELRAAQGGARERVVTLLTQLATRYGSETTEGEIMIHPPLSMRELASWAGISPRQAGRAMTWLRAERVVRTARKKIVVAWQELRRVLRDLGRDD